MTSDLGWVLIRQDDERNRYRVGRFATRAEAERVAERLEHERDRELGREPDRDPDRARDQDGDGDEDGGKGGDGAGERRYVIERVAPRVMQT